MNAIILDSTARSRRAVWAGRTAVVGAVLWTGYLGGAIATHLRLGDPLLSHTLFPIYVAALLWGGLWLRDARVSALFAGPTSLHRPAVEKT